LPPLPLPLPLLLPSLLMALQVVTRIALLFSSLPLQSSARRAAAGVVKVT
jgi:hypothetical protein